MGEFKIAVVGSGSLARAVCYSFAVGAVPATVTVLARSGERAAEVAYVAGVRARLARSAVTFEAREADSFDTAFGEIAPHVVLNCASHHSPWEQSSGWMDLVRRAGFAITLPLQAQPAMAIARAAAEARALLVNACFPDLVNPLLTALGLPVHCGVGNVAVLTASLRTALELAPERELRVLGHHVHLYPPRDPADDALVWLDGQLVPNVTELLARQRATPRPELNHITGYTAALLVQDLLTGAEVRTNLPGPLGLPGGYPVLLRDSTIALDLPGGLDKASAVAWNQRAALADGGRVDGDRVTFAPRAAEALEAHLPDLAAGFPVDEITTVLDRIVELRDRLRTS